MAHKKEYSVPSSGSENWQIYVQVTPSKEAPDDATDLAFGWMTLSEWKELRVKYLWPIRW